MHCTFSKINLVHLLIPAFASFTPGFSFDFDFHGSLGSDRYQHYVPPVTNPLFNETPYITTEIRAIYIHNEIPGDFLTRGGSIDLWAAEIRAALTERLGFIASKDGYADIHFDQVLPQEDGFANISFGFKYAMVSQPENEAILTLGAEYEPPTGNLKTDGVRLQGKGNGVIDLFAAGAKAFGKCGLEANVGVNLAVDQDHDTSQFHYAFHADYEVLPNFYPLIELNGFTPIEDGNRTVATFEGIDLVNFGSTDAGTVVTFGAGARYRCTEHLRFGVAYETPVTDREDIMEWRITFDMILSY